MDVTGEANLPPGYYLWVLARRKNYEADDVWWPQNEGVVNPSDGKWTVTTYFGKKVDIGCIFQIAVAVFDMDDHIDLKEWLREASEREVYDPIPMPPTAAPPQIFEVHKVGHD